MYSMQVSAIHNQYYNISLTKEVIFRNHVIIIATACTSISLQIKIISNITDTNKLHTLHKYINHIIKRIVGRQVQYNY